MKKCVDYVGLLVGIILLIGGLFFIKFVENLNEILLALPYAAIGLGCGIFGHSMGNIIEKSNSKLQKQVEIDKNDERNIAINNRAKAKAYDCMTYVFGALMITFAIMGVELIPILLLVFAYLFVHGYAIYYHCKYEKEM